MNLDSTKCYNLKYHSSMTIPAVSVVMPAFNASSHIRLAIESILDQNLNDFELIIVNDGSTDETRLISEAMAALDSRIVIVNQDNSGIAVAINNAIQIARAPLIARMDSDDIAMPNRLEKQVGYLAEHLETALVSCSFVPFTDPSSPSQAPVHLPPDHSCIYATLAFCSPICHPGVLARREVFTRFAYRPGITAEDHDLWCRAIHCFRFANLTEPLLLYRRHEGSVSMRKARRLKWSTLRSGLAHIARDPLAYRRECEASLGIDRSAYHSINWKWMDRINRVLGVE